ncbi:hypothetical protein PFISCL1PPCAC_1033, partial [Pristionchus fissidentatus]
ERFACVVKTIEQESDGLSLVSIVILSPSLSSFPACRLLINEEFLVYRFVERPQMLLHVFRTVFARLAVQTDAVACNGSQHALPQLLNFGSLTVAVLEVDVVVELTRVYPLVRAGDSLAAAIRTHDHPLVGENTSHLPLALAARRQIALKKPDLSLLFAV